MPHKKKILFLLFCIPFLFAINKGKAKAEIYVNEIPLQTPVTVYWTGECFHADEETEGRHTITDSGGEVYTDLPSLLADIAGDIIICMKETNY